MDAFAATLIPAIIDFKYLLARRDGGRIGMRKGSTVGDEVLRVRGVPHGFGISTVKGSRGGGWRRYVYI